MKKKYPLYTLIFSIAIFALAFTGFTLAGLLPWIHASAYRSRIGIADQTRSFMALLIILNSVFGLIYFTYLSAKKKEKNRILSVLQLIFLISILFIGSIPLQCPTRFNNGQGEEIFIPIGPETLCERSAPRGEINTYMINPLIDLSAGIIAILMFFISLYFLFQEEPKKSK